MLSIDKPEDLMQEVSASEHYRNDHLDTSCTLVKRYVGNWYRKDLRSGAARPENMIFSYVAQALPLIIFDNPQVTVKAIRPVTLGAVAQEMRYALNSWIKSDHVYQEARLSALDMLFSYGVLGVTCVDTGGALRPRIFRIAPEAFLFDRQCNHLRRARFYGHQYRQSLEELKSDPLVDEDAVSDLQPDDRREFGGMKAPLDSGRHYERRDEVTLYDVYLVRERMVCTLAATQYGKSKFVRRPRAFEGPPDGPYVPFGVYDVPSNPLWVSPLMQLADHDEEINAHLAAAAEEAASEKNLALVDANVPGAKEAIEFAPTGGILTIPGLTRDGVTPLHVGGVTEGRMAYIASRRDTADRTMATSDARRGKPQGVTATESAIAKQSQDNRTADAQNSFREALKQALHRAAWYMYHDQGVAMPVAWEERGQPREGLFQGGIYEGQQDTAWEDYQLEFEPHSMRRTDPLFEQEQANVMVQTLAGLLPMMRQYPEVDWRFVISTIGEANNMPALADQLLRQDPLMMAMMQGGMPAPGMGGAPELPETGGAMQNIPSPGALVSRAMP
jgi:hypothetical protein